MTLTARPTVYKGHQMRSRLEAGFAAWLDRHHFEWEYEPRAFASQEGQYLPDFQLFGIPVYGEDRPLFIDVKPSASAINGLYKGESYPIVAASEPSAALLAVFPNKPIGYGTVDIGGYCRAIWIKSAGGQVSIAKMIAPIDGPWYGEYWKPGCSTAGESA